MCSSIQWHRLSGLFLVVVSVVWMMGCLGGPSPAHVAPSDPVVPRVAQTDETPLPLYLPDLPLARSTGPIVGMELLGQIGGAGKAIDLDGQTAYLGLGPRLVVLDVAQSHAPRVIGRSSVLPHVVEGLDVSLPYAYLAVGEAGLYVLDVSTPDTPKIIGVSQIPRGATAVVVRDGLAYVSTHNDGLVVLNVSDPRRPAYVGMLDKPDEHGNIVSNVFLDGEYAYLSTQSHGVHIVDISDPSRPTSVTHIDVPQGVEAAYVAEGVAYVAATHAGLRVFDVSDPRRPNALATLDRDDESSSEFVQDVYVADGLAYLADHFNGLRIVDVSARGTARDISELEPPGEVNRLIVDEDVVFAAVNGGLRSFDVSDPRQPKQVGMALSPGDADDVHVVDDTAFVVDEELGLWSIDVSKARAPRALDYAEVAGTSWSLYSEGSVTYVMTQPRAYARLRHVRSPTPDCDRVRRRRSTAASASTCTTASPMWLA